jgi:hypothetical protein
MGRVEGGQGEISQSGQEVVCEVAVKFNDRIPFLLVNLIDITMLRQRIARSVLTVYNPMAFQLWLLPLFIPSKHKEARPHS